MSPVDVVKVRSISERVGEGADARTVSASLGEPVPDSISAARVKALRELGAVGPRPGADDADAAAAAVPVVPRDRAALDAVGRGANPDGGAEGVHGPDDPGGGSGSGSSSRRSEPSADLPDDAPDAAQEDVGTLARYIDEQSLNAPQTVALSEGDPELAAKVLEAERVAQGGDARVTVERPLSKLAAKAQGAEGDGGDAGGTSGAETPPPVPPPPGAPPA